MEPTTSVDTQQSTTFVTTSNPPGDQQTRTMQSVVSINTDQISSLHPQHLANLLLLVASQLSATPINSSLVQHQHPTVMADPPTTTPPQDDQLSEASAISPPNVPAVIPPSMASNTVIPPTKTSTHITLDLAPASSPPGPSLLFQHACVNVSSEVSLLILTTCLLGPCFPCMNHANPPHTHSHSRYHLREVGLKLLQHIMLPVKLTPFHYGWKHGMFTPLTLLSANPSRALELFGYQCLITSANLHLPFSA